MRTFTQKLWMLLLQEPWLTPFIIGFHNGFQEIFNRTKVILEEKMNNSKKLSSDLKTQGLESGRISILMYAQGRATVLGAVSIIRYSYCSRYPGIWSYWQGLGF